MANNHMIYVTSHIGVDKVFSSSSGSTLMSTWLDVQGVHNFGSYGQLGGVPAYYDNSKRNQRPAFY